MRTIRELRARCSAPATVGLVPTMGAFHEGHLSLLRAARAENDTVVVSLFVNPAQFGRGEDLDAVSPRRGARRRARRARGRRLLFAPPPEEMYPPGFQTWVEVEELVEAARGRLPARPLPRRRDRLPQALQHRPAERAYFGQKDAQQVAVLQRMVRDLDLELELRVLPTVRDADGLALSSRNAYLSPEERDAALALPRALATRDPDRPRALLTGSTSTTSRSPTSSLPSSPPPSASARPA